MAVSKQAGHLDGQVFRCDLASSVWPAGSDNFTMDLEVFAQIKDQVIRIEILDKKHDEYLVCSIEEFTRYAKKKKKKSGEKSSWHLDISALPRFDSAGRKVAQRSEVNRYGTSGLILTPERLEEVVAQYLEHDEFVFDVETVSDTDALDPRRNETIWISLGGPGMAHAIPMGHPLGSVLLEPERKERESYIDPDNPTKTGNPRTRTITIPPRYSAPPAQMYPSEVYDRLEPLLFSERRKIGHNVKFDLLTVAKYYGGEAPPPPYGDTQFCEYLLDPSKTHERTLGACVRRHLDFSYDKSIGKRIAQTPFDVAARYAYFDGKYTWLLWRTYQEILGKAKMLGTLDLEHDTLVAVVEMGMEGALLDIDKVKTLHSEVSLRCDKAQVRIYTAVGRELNLNSPKQKVEYLYGERKWRPIKYTCGCKVSARPCRKKEHGNPSADAESLEALYRKHKDKVLEDILEFSEWDKIRGTYLQSWMNKEIGGRVYTNLNQIGTETSRFSSNDPNLQNVPRRGDKSELIRSLFIAEPGHLLVIADYAQIELRVLAHYTRDPTLTGIFFDLDRDPHTETAAMIFGVPVEDVEGWMRDVAKTINFGIVYGAGPQKVMDVAKVSMERAREMLGDHSRAFPRIYSWKNKVIKECRKRKPPHVETLLGHRRYLPEIFSQNDDVRSAAERQAVNTLIQGCLPSDGRVLTADGWTRMDKFQDGSLVWTGERFAPAIRLDRGEDERVRLHLSDGRTFDCDTRHRLLVSDGSWPRWAGVDELVGLPLVRDAGQDWGRKDRDVEDWYWLGRMTGDGHLAGTDKRLQVWSLVFGDKERDALGSFITYLGTRFRGGTSSTKGYNVSDHGGSVQVTGGTCVGREHWKSLGLVPGAKSRSKRIPEVVFTLDRERRQAFLDGYFDADGHYRNRSKKITSVNIPLLQDALRLLQTLGQTGKISSPMVNVQGVVWYDLYIHSNPQILMVERVEHLGVREIMYTLSVDDDRHAYSSEGLISKNSAADIIKLALVRLRSMLPEESRMVLTVHDEVMVTAPEDAAEATVASMREAMEFDGLLRVPLVADAKVAPNWAAAK